MMMRARFCLAVAALLSLVGCGGGDFDGTYVGATGMITAAAMRLEDGTAIVETLNTMKREVIATREFDAEIRNGKLVLSRGGLAFMYGIAVDEQGLECLSDSCKGYGQLGAGGMPRTWKRYVHNK
jgi:hypothetical protein